MKKTRLILLIALFLLNAKLMYGQTYTPDWASLDKRPVPQWFSDAKFGIFIHWGVYSVPAWAPANADIGVYAKYAEWYWWRINEESTAGILFRNYHNQVYGSKFQYQDFAVDFTARHFDPVQWTDIFKRAGAKYIVLTSKHHEGFTLWPSSQSWNWNSVDIGPHRDLCGDLTTAVKAAGLHMGFYYSLYEWYNPLYRNNLEKYVDDHMIPQMKDLVTRYNPDIVWTDGEWDHPSEKWKSTQFLAWLFNESPVKETVCVNDRWGKETRGVHGGYFTTEYDLVNDKKGVGNTDRPWEECRGIGTSFGYNRMENPDNYMTSDALIDMLVAKVASGGNLLLDIGPTADGLIPVIMQQRLLEMGVWLKVNGEAIYGTQPWENAPSAGKDQTVFYTGKGSDLYVICTRWPDKAMVVPGLKKTGKVTLLGSMLQMKSGFSGGKLTIFPPAVNPATNPCDYAWVFKIENAL
jgi:alpha-L-fucosidase